MPFVRSVQSLCVFPLQENVKYLFNQNNLQTCLSYTRSTILWKSTFTVFSYWSKFSANKFPPYTREKKKEMEIQKCLQNWIYFIFWFLKFSYDHPRRTRNPTVFYFYLLANASCFFTNSICFVYLFAICSRCNYILGNKQECLLRTFFLLNIQIS